MTNLQRNGLRNRYLLASDAFLLVGSVVFAFAIRFEGWNWPPAQRDMAIVFALSIIPLKLLIFYSQGLYRRIWRHAGVAELEDILRASGIAAVLSFAIGGLLLPGTGLTASRVPLSVLFMDAFMTMAFVATPPASRGPSRANTGSCYSRSSVSCSPARTTPRSRSRSSSFP